MGNNCYSRQSTGAEAPLVRKNSEQLKKPSGRISLSKKYTMDDGVMTFLKPPKMQKQNTPNTLTSSFVFIQQDDLEGELSLVRTNSEKSNIKLPNEKILEGSLELEKRSSSPSDTESLARLIQTYDRQVCLSNINKTKSRMEQSQESVIKQYQSQIHLDKKWSLRQARHMEVDLLRLKNSNKEMNTQLKRYKKQNERLKGQLYEKQGIIKEFQERQKKIRKQRNCLIEVLEDKSKQLGRANQQIKKMKKNEEIRSLASLDNLPLLNKVNNWIKERQELFRKISELIQNCKQQQNELKLKVNQVKAEKPKSTLMKIKSKISSDDMSHHISINQSEKYLQFVKQQKVKLENILKEEKTKTLLMRSTLQLKKGLIVSVTSQLEKNIANKQWKQIPKIFSELDQRNQLAQFTTLISSMNDNLLQLTEHYSMLPAGVPMLQ